MKHLLIVLVCIVMGCGLKTEERYEIPKIAQVGERTPQALFDNFSRSGETDTTLIYQYMRGPGEYCRFVVNKADSVLLEFECD